MMMLKKIRATYRLWFRKSQALNISISVAQREQVLKLLHKYFNATTEQNRVVLNQVTDEICESLQISDWSPTAKNTLLFEGAFSQAFWFHGQLTGLTASWEFKVRLLALKLGIKSSIEIQSKSKQNRHMKSIQHRKLSDIIKEINKKTKGRLNLRLDALNDLRDGIAHCNPQGMKAYAAKVFGKKSQTISRGEVVVMSLKDSSVLNMGDLKNESQIEEFDLFSWFLEIFNSQLPKMAFNEFDKSIRQMEKLTHFAALSFDGREMIFSKFIHDAQKVDRESMEYYRKDYGLMPHESHQTVEDFFEAINSVLA